MIWPVLTFVALALAVGVHLWWQHRFIVRELAHQKEINAMREKQRSSTEALQAQQTALFNSMTEGLLVLDERDTIQMSNRAVQEFFNAANGLTGKTVLEAFRLHSLAEIVERLKTERQVLDYEVEVPGLKSRWLQINASSIVDDGNQRLGAVLVFHDVSRLKTLENTRRDFVANVSHELRTPLSMIKGFAETLLGGAMNDPAVSTRFAQMIEKHADRLAHLIDDLLTISHLEGERITLAIRPIHLKQIVDAVFEDLRSRAESQCVTMTSDIVEEMMVNGDADRLKQVFWNLIENAIKYGRKNGRVTVSAAQRNSEAVEISIADDGCGIPADALPRIFERFYRVDKARSRETGGTGLGLAIVKHIIQSHDGKIRAESVLDQGTTFFVELPTPK